MGYAIAGALVLLVITALIVLLVQRSASKGSPRSEDGEGPGIGSDGESPLGDTSQHAGTQDDGMTVGNADAGRHGGAGQRREDGYSATSEAGEDHEDPHRAAHVQRPGEGEGAARI